ncbi:OmpA family protein [Octadecabacter sp. G9-8]|uniref:OmpA family protein n=1 Tax=Octadecabacter dasysiphoniae TaxID=2909341 RepID=A0ABS9D1X7_9RHOB|nr:OmpA family protein [Octadecabacter dasysiphoniae]MCF2872655.1 OmpA family protein [Octadecabacter dasysiphoniae]
MSITKHLPWIAPTAAILAVGVGVGSFDGLLASDDQDIAPISQTTNTQDPAIAALAAVTAAVEAAPVEPENTSDQLAALLSGPTEEPVAAPVVEDVDVTRSQGFATATVAPTQDVVAAAPQQPAPQVGADFFSAAQANLAQANSCANDLRNLATQAKVYFPSGALTGEATGIAQARLIGTIASRCQGVSIEVQGHSDASGDPAINLRLSQERAEAVIGRIAAGGIDTSRFVAVGMGSARPSGVTGVESSAYYDRRVEFEILDTVQTAAFTAPAFGTADYSTVACVIQLQEAVDATTISYAPGSVTVSRDDLNAAMGLAQLASACPQARLRVVGQHAEEYGTVEDAGTGRMRAVALMTTLVGAGYASEQIIIGAPSDSRPIEGLSNSRVDFDVILEEL